MVPVYNNNSFEISTITQNIKAIEQADLAIKQSIAQANKALSKASDAETSAYNAWKQDVGWFNKGEIIENLQSSGKRQAEALKDLAKANLENTDVMKQFLNGQKRIAESVKKLFALGVMNMAANRTVVRELELKMRNASQEELSELAQNEIMAVVNQLKAQEDIWNRIESQKAGLENHDTKLADLTRQISGLSSLRSELQSIKNSVSSQLSDQERTLKNDFDKLKSSIDSEMERKNTLLKAEIDKIAREIANVEKLKQEVGKQQKDIEAKFNKQISDIQTFVNDKNVTLNAQITKQKEDIETFISNKNNEIETLIKVKDKEIGVVLEKQKEELTLIATKVDERISTETRKLIEDLSKKTFFDSLGYKIAIGIMALGALAISVLNFVK